MSRLSHRPWKGTRIRLGVLVLAVLVAACGDVLGSGGSAGPSLRSVTPAPGEKDVSVLARIRIDFSGPMKEGTVAGGVRLKQGDREIQVRLILQDPKTLLIEPTDPFDFGTSYRVILETSLKSRSGNSLSEQESWSFSTEGLPIPAPDSDTLRATLGALAHDSMMGRGSGSEWEAVAARLILDRFRAYGLSPRPEGGMQGFQAISRRSMARLSSQNVLASVPGAGELASEWVVVGAHYDHVGVRGDVDGVPAIHNGADDNASGTALLLEVARIFQAHINENGLPAANRRSVLFIAFGAEEEGLLGSCYHALVSPVAPTPQIRAMMNFDMVGRLRENVLQVRGFETSEDWPDMVANSNKPGLLLYDPPPCRSCSDFACFRDRGVPYIWFFTGVHDQYHTPADDIERIDFSGLSKIGRLALSVLTRLVVMPDGPRIT